jgi:hypothetical protein
MSTQSRCPLCSSPTTRAFTATVLRKYAVGYFSCPRCGFLGSEAPYWLEEAYRHPIALADTGALSRNSGFVRPTSCFLSVLFDRHKAFLDYAGGFGVFTRMMRDIGFDYYWIDKMTPNLIARGFEATPGMTFEAVTAFEVAEHFPSPLEGFTEMAGFSRNIIFSTLLLPQPVPPLDWWYYVFQHGQHIAFYSRDSLKVIADALGLHLYTNGTNFHLMTEKRIPAAAFDLLLRLSGRGLYPIVRRLMASRSMSDLELLSTREETLPVDPGT